MNKKLIIIGASGHGKVVADIALKIGRYEEIYFLDDNPFLKMSMGIPVVADSKSVGTFIENSDIFVAIGNAAIRQKIQEELCQKSAIIPILVHPSAIIGQNVQIDVGTVVMAGAVVNPDCKIGKGCIINTCASLDHDCQIAEYVHISVGVHLAGNVKVGSKTWIGAGATISNNIEITSNCTIGAGTVVIHNIKKNGTYVGVPARML